ncbi:MAG TPA: DNA replication/repair protein RecF, partial [Nitrococcus sp.]|nr:DNA replication/repair protein RecF [Nitrococcus sp.]
ALALDPRVNLIWGKNASGKTSLLEAVHLLARGRSFTRTRPDHLIQHGSHAFILRAGIQTSTHKAWIGMERVPGRTRVRLDERDVSSLSEIAWLLPIHTLNTESQRLFTEGPKERRSTLDWGVFHVESDYPEHWRRFRRALQQRNAALQAGDARVIRAWEPDLAAAAAAVDTSRRIYLEALWPFWQSLIKDWLPQLDLYWVFRSGWPEGECLPAILEQARAQELERGHTLYGPHRADLRFMLDNIDAVQRLSRGQQKLVVIALRLAQAELTAKSGRQRPLILVDDLAAELDAERREQVLAALLRMDVQLLLTALSRNELQLPKGALNVFHVEQGCYREMI